MTASTGVLFIALMVLAYVLAPSMLIWGWVRWAKTRPRRWTIASTLSFVGFLFASASCLFALMVVLYGNGGGFEHTASVPYDSPNYVLFYRCIRVGVLLSLAGLMFSIGGVWQKNSTRWQAPACAIGTVAFWLLATYWP
jgi:hypothetical protein